MSITLIKDLVREIKSSFGRFFAIFAICFIGVAFFAGVTAASRDMKYSADKYYKEYNLFDYRLISTIGFDKSDVDAVRDNDGVKGVYPSYSTDVLSKNGTTQSVFKLMSLPEDTSDSNNDYINRIRLKEGRMPENSNECVLKYESIKNSELNIGDTLEFTRDDGDINNVLSNTTYTVVGFVYTPYYLSYELGASTIGNGTVSCIAFVNESSFRSNYYSDIYVTIDGADGYDSYSDEYFDYIGEYENTFKDISEVQIHSKMLDTSQYQWYVLDRNSHYSFADYENCADRMTNIAKVFPVFFFFVAALVCLTTMTRMIDEQRGVIGTYKALGYSKAAIAVKYILYAMIASLLGGIMGAILGMHLFPYVIYNTWNIVYQMPAISYDNQINLAAASVLSICGITTLATFLACYKELFATPSLLMRPKAPKNGKKILLEHISFIWKHMSFTAKVTARNIFRYKKRFIMTVVGISGCTALLLAGFGIRDSVSGLVTNQYSEILSYDYSAEYKPGTNKEEKDNAIDVMTQGNYVSEYCTISSEKAYAGTSEDVNENDDKSVTFMCFDDISLSEKFIKLRLRSNKETVHVSNDGVCISEKLSNDLNVKKGDYIYVRNLNGDIGKVKIDNIIEMYVNHYVFISQEYYNTIFGYNAELNTIIGKINGDAKIAQDEISKQLLDTPCIDSIAFFTGSIDKFNDMISSLDIITYVLLVSSGLLAFVVLYNLTNVNISERLREIATIKVLGFYNNEVAEYVYRENIFITIIGALVGLLLGVVLHDFIMKVIEMDGVMFGNYRSILSYILSFVITIIFSLMVNAVMYRKLKKIPMVESLKSVE